MTEPDAPPPPAAEAQAEEAPKPAPEAPPSPAKPATEPPEPTGDVLFDTLWGKVMESWEDDKVHASILEYAVGAEKLPDLAGHYRALKDDDVKGPRAKKRLDAIVLAATQLMMSMKTPVNTKVPLPIMLTVVALFASAVAFAAYAVVHR